MADRRRSRDANIRGKPEAKSPRDAHVWLLGDLLYVVGSIRARWSGIRHTRISRTGRTPDDGGGRLHALRDQGLREPDQCLLRNPAIAAATSSSKDVSEVIVRPGIHFSIDHPGLFGVGVMIELGQTALSKAARFHLQQSWH